MNFKIEIKFYDKTFDKIEGSVQLKDFPAYWISPCGKLMNANIGTFLKGAKTTKRVCLWANEKQYFLTFHFIVATAFIPNPHNYKFVIHRDGDNDNNHVDNLKWSPTKQTGHLLKKK